MVWLKYSLYCGVICFLFSCASGQLYLKNPKEAIIPDSGTTPDYTIYALGDAGELNEQSKAVMSHLANLANDDRHPGTVLFVGDNVYPAGLAPETDSIGHYYGKDVLLNQVNPLKSY